MRLEFSLKKIENSSTYEKNKQIYDNLEYVISLKFNIRIKNKSKS